VKALPVGRLIDGRFRVVEVAREEEESARLTCEADGRRVFVRQAEARSIPAGEARALAFSWRTLEVPGLARVVDVLVEGGFLFVVVEAVDGPTLADQLSLAGRPLDEADLLERAGGMCETLSELHAQGVAAGALASDTLVWNGARLVLVELAAERALRARARGRALDPRVDVYALGRVLYQAGTGVTPDGSGDRVLEGSLAPMHTLNEAISVRTEMAIERMLEVEPSRRPADVAEAAALLGIDLSSPGPNGSATAVPSVADSGRPAGSFEVPDAAAPPPPAPPPPPPPPRPGAAPPPARAETPPLAAVSTAAVPSLGRAASQRPISHGRATMVLLVVVFLIAAWVARLLYVVEDQVRVRVDPAARPIVLRPIGHVPIPRGSPLPPTITGGDGTVMVRVPAGEFPLGVPDPDSLDGPQVTWSLPAFYIDRTEVTAAQFALFVRATGYVARGPWRRYVDPDHTSRPVAGVTLDDAEEYARWLGKRIPTEVEWEKAARGAGGRIYPWGDSLPDARMAPLFAVTSDTSSGPRDVDAAPQGASPYGVLGMAGNVWEWTVSEWRPYSGSRANNDLYRLGLGVLRGGSWNFPMRDVATSLRMPMPTRLWAPDVGFRCVLPVADEP
jgi:formylglycine-generating enzyme required for sulfatase activity